jgi:hypothetical protein
MRPTKCCRESAAGPAGRGTSRPPLNPDEQVPRGAFGAAHGRCEPALLRSPPRDPPGPPLACGPPSPWTFAEYPSMCTQRQYPLCFTALPRYGVSPLCSRRSAGLALVTPRNRVRELAGGSWRRTPPGRRPLGCSHKGDSRAPRNSGAAAHPRGSSTVGLTPRTTTAARTVITSRTRRFPCGGKQTTGSAKPARPSRAPGTAPETKRATMAPMPVTPGGIASVPQRPIARTITARIHRPRRRVRRRRQESERQALDGARPTSG